MSQGFDKLKTTPSACVYRVLGNYSLLRTRACVHRREAVEIKYLLDSIQINYACEKKAMLKVNRHSKESKAGT